MMERIVVRVFEILGVDCTPFKNLGEIKPTHLQLMPRAKSSYIILFQEAYQAKLKADMYASDPDQRQKLLEIACEKYLECLEMHTGNLFSQIEIGFDSNVTTLFRECIRPVQLQPCSEAAVAWVGRIVKQHSSTGLLLLSGS